MVQAKNTTKLKEKLRRSIVRALRAQGFSLRRGVIVPKTGIDKGEIRDIHQTAVQHKAQQARPGLEKKEELLLKRIASGKQVVLRRISPRLVQVQRGSLDELLFRYATLHWSIPVSSGYGRRLRFLVVDEYNGKLIGVIGLGDPVFGLKDRDEWIGWNVTARRARLRHIMDAFVLGAVPPYSRLLCGKLVALLAASAEVRKAFQEKYRGRQSVISRKRQDGRLALITTTSALGRSSVYNRLKLPERVVYQSVGFTSGSGEFQFCNGVYSAIREHAEAYCDPTAKQGAWGSGFRNRREVVKKCLASLGLSTDLMYHGFRREVFVVPLAGNAAQFLRGEHSRLRWHKESAEELFQYFRDRWLLPRAKWDKSYRDFAPATWRLWED